MLLIDVHQLDIILGHAVALGALEREVDNVRRIFRLHGQDVLVLRALEHLGQRAEVDAEGDVAVAAEGREGFGLEHHGDEGDVGVVHGLEGDAGVIAVEVAVLDEVFDGVNDLGRYLSMCRCDQAIVSSSYLLEQGGLLETCFQHCRRVSSGLLAGCCKTYSCLFVRGVKFKSSMEAIAMQ